MKNYNMNKITTVFLSACLIACVYGCKHENKQNSANNKLIETSIGKSIADSISVYVYYFHGKQRCPTCNAVEEIAKETVKNLCQEIGNVHFISVDREEKTNRIITQKFNIISNALIV